MRDGTVSERWYGMAWRGMEWHGNELAGLQMYAPRVWSAEAAAFEPTAIDSSLPLPVGWGSGDASKANVTVGGSTEAISSLPSALVSGEA